MIVPCFCTIESRFKRSSLLVNEVETDNAVGQIFKYPLRNLFQTLFGECLHEIVPKLYLFWETYSWFTIPCSLLTLDMGLFFGDTHQPLLVFFSCSSKLSAWSSRVDQKPLQPCFHQATDTDCFQSVYYVLESYYLRYNFCTRGEVHGRGRALRNSGALNQVRCCLRETEECFPSQAVNMF